MIWCRNVRGSRASLMKKLVLQTRSSAPARLDRVEDRRWRTSSASHVKSRWVCAQLAAEPATVLGLDVSSRRRSAGPRLVSGPEPGSRSRRGDTARRGAASLVMVQGPHLDGTRRRACPHGEERIAVPGDRSASFTSTQCRRSRNRRARAHVLRVGGVEPDGDRFRGKHRFEKDTTKGAPAQHATHFTSSSTDGSRTGSRRRTSRRRIRIAEREASVAFTS